MRHHEVREAAHRALPVLALAVCACCSGGTDPMVGAQAAPEVSVTREIEGLRLTLSADRAAYEIGTPVQLTLVVENVSAAEITLEFPTSRQYDFEVSREGRLVWSDSFDRLYATVLTSLTLEPGQRWQQTAVWNGTANDGSAVPPGPYRLGGLLTPGKGSLPTKLLEVELSEP